MNKIEACIAAYPVDPYVEETKDCFPNAPLIVDHSEKYPSFKWNHAIDHCKSEFLALPHSDDLYLPDFLPTMVAALEAQPAAVAAFCMDDFIDKDGRRIPGGTRLPIPEQDAYDFKTIINAINRHGNFLRCPSVVLRRSLVGDTRFDTTGKFGTAIDIAFYLELLLNHPIIIVNKPLVRYRVHEKQDTQSQRVGGPIDHWLVMEHFLKNHPDDFEWDMYILCHKAVQFDKQAREVVRVKERKTKDTKVRLVVVHEPPDNAGTGVVSAHRVREYNRDGTGEITFYVFPQNEATAIQEGFFRGCPIIVCTPKLFPQVIRQYKPFAIEYHHTLFWGDEILQVETDARKELFLHDQWMWSEHPHEDGPFRDTRSYLKEISIFGNSEWTCRTAKEKLGVEVDLFDPFVPLTTGPKFFRKRIGFFGGFAPIKGIGPLLKAMQKLPDVQLLMFSEVPPELREGRILYGYENVLCMGAYQRTEMADLAGLVSLVVVPSLFESCGLVKKEIESLGVPVLATNTGGMQGTIRPDDAEVLVEALK